MQTGTLPTTTPTRRLFTGTNVPSYAILVGSTGMRGARLASLVAERLRRQNVPAVSVDADDALPALADGRRVPILYGPRATIALHTILRSLYDGRVVGLSAELADDTLTELAGYAGRPVETRLRSLGRIAEACVETLERPERAYLN